MSKREGGFAFPLGSGGGWRNEGMTLRDWFAGLAMQAIIQNDRSIYESASARAYSVADAMIAEREK